MTVCCSICFEDIKIVDENQKALLICGHEFHPACILKWFQKNTSCPICRQQHFKAELKTEIATEIATELSPGFTSLSQNLLQAMMMTPQQTEFNIGRRYVRRILIEDDETENTETATHVYSQFPQPPLESDLISSPDVLSDRRRTSFLQSIMSYEDTNNYNTSE